MDTEGARRAGAVRYPGLQPCDAGICNCAHGGSNDEQPVADERCSKARSVLALLALMAASWLQAGQRLRRRQWNKAAFDVKNSLDDAVKALGGASAAESKDIA